jgi:hypothetical protein
MISQFVLLIVLAAIYPKRSQQLWTIRAQGNANIAYTNDNNKILRIAKNPDKDPRIQLEYSQMMCKLLSEFGPFYSASVVKLSNYKMHPIPDNSMGILMDDVTDAISFELKPKSGILDIAQDGEICNHCKLRKAAPNCSSNYCPNMLFSANKTVLKCALEQVMDSPKSHFKVHYVGNIFRFKDALVNKIISKDILDLLVDALLDSEILLKLKAAQELLHFNIKDIQEIYNTFTPEQPKIKDFSQTLLDIESQRSLSENQKLESYLMSRTLRDLSLMISFQSSISKRNTIKARLSNSDQFYSIDILDLDVKPISKIPKYYYDAMEAAGNSNRWCHRTCK